MCQGLGMRVTVVMQHELLRPSYATLCKMCVLRFRLLHSHKFNARGTITGGLGTVYSILNMNADAALDCAQGERSHPNVSVHFLPPA